MKQIKDYLQTQALQLDAEETAAARAAAQAVLSRAEAHIEPEIWQHAALPEALRAQAAAIEQLYLAADAAFDRHPVQTAALYGLLPDNEALVRLVRLGAPVEDRLDTDETAAWQHLPARTARSGWANIAEDTARWFDTGELQGRHNLRAAAQASLPVCGEDGIVYGVLHLETAEPLPPAELAAWTGLALGVLPVLRNLLPRDTESENDAA